MEALSHAANAVRHAEALADEAEEAGLDRAAARLRQLGLRTAELLDNVLSLEDQLRPAREARLTTRTYLTSAYKEASLRLDHALGADDAAAFAPGAVLDVAERSRFRVRRLRAHLEAHPEDTERLDGTLARLEHRLLTYERAVDRYLEVSGQLTFLKDKTLRESHLLRCRLEEAKTQLLARLPPDCAAYKRVRGRAVRTRRARWIDAAATQVAERPEALFTTSDGPHEPMLSIH
jgi:hypothetical protein